MRVALYSPDRARFYDGRTREADGVGGGITARLSLVEALAAIGHEVTAYIHCEAPLEHRGVRYVPLDSANRIECDVFIAITTGGDRSFAPLRAIDVRTRLRIIWVQGVPKPADLEAVQADYVYVASNFLRDVCAGRWGVPERQLFVCYNGVHQQSFQAVDADPPPRDPYGIAYIGPPEKGLDACINVLRRLRESDPRYHLDVFGGDRLWGKPTDGVPVEPGVEFKGLLGQTALARELYRYEYCLALQAMEEGFGIAVQEAKRAGVIVIASAVGAYTETIRHRADGYLVAGSHATPAVQQETADLILKLAADPLRRDRIRRLARATPWSWDLAARSWTAHWSHVLKDDSGSRSHILVRTTPGVVLDLPDGRHRLHDGAYFPTVYPRSPLRERLGVPWPPRLMIAAYIGHGNLGDECILSVILDEMQQARPDLEPIVTSCDPDATARQHDVATVNEKDLNAIREAMDDCEAIVHGGGGLFHDTFGVDASTANTSGHWGLTTSATFAGLASEKRTPFLILGAGASSLTTDEGPPLVRAVIAQAAGVTVRDDASRAALVAAGVNVERIAVTADPAFLLPSASPDTTRAYLSKLDLPDSSLVTVAVRSWDVGVESKHWESAVAAALDVVADTRQCQVLFVPFHVDRRLAEDDVVVSERIWQLMRWRDAARIAGATINQSPSLVQGIFHESRVVLTMRLHALILAANAGAPVVALRYDDKVSQTAARLGCSGDVIDISRVTIDTLAGRLTDAMDARDRFRAEYARRLPGLQQAARQNFVLAASAIAGSAATAAANPDLPIPAARPDAVNMASVTKALVPASWRRPLRDIWRGQLMSRAAFAFDRFKRARSRTHGTNLSGVHGQSEPGLVSIVLPVHNGGTMLAEAIDSILGQTWRAIELILVDDGSTDDSGAVADATASRDDRVKVIHQSLQRLPAALSRGFREARGELLTWASADNRLKPRAIEQLADCLRRHPDWDAVYANLDLIGEDGRPLTGSPHYRSYQAPHGSAHIRLPASAAELNVRDNNFIGAGFLYRRRVADLIGDYSTARFGVEDYDFWMRVNALLTLRHADFDDAVVDYRFHRASLTARADALGLPEARHRLMVFDHFRRDSYLWPLVWVFPLKTEMPYLLQALERRAREAGHIIYNGSYPLAALPTPWVPVVEVNSPAAAVRDSDGTDTAGSLKVHVTDDGVTFGRSSLGIAAPDLDRLFHAIDIRARSHVTRQIEELAVNPPATGLTASVVICAGRPLQTLTAAVEAALAQEFPAEAFEVIVVNNRPDDPELGAIVGALPGQVRVVPCPIAGHSAARNAGLGAARGRYVCYLDDDSIPDPRWLAHLCRAFDEHPETAVAGGPILLRTSTPAPAALGPGWESYWSHFAPSATSYTDVTDAREFPWGANWAARRSALLAIGGFRLAFGRSGDDHRGGEELVAASFAQRLGYRVAVVPDAVVHHQVDPARFTGEHVRRTMITRHLVAHATRRDMIQPGTSSVWSGLARLLFHHIDPGVRSWRHFWQDVAYRKGAQLRLLRAQVADLKQRWH